MIAVTAAHRIAAGGVPARAALRCRAGAAGDAAGGTDADAVVLTRAADAPIDAAAVAVVAVGIARARLARDGRGARRRHRRAAPVRARVAAARGVRDAGAA